MHEHDDRATRVSRKHVERFGERRSVRDADLAVQLGARARSLSVRNSVEVKRQVGHARDEV